MKNKDKEFFELIKNRSYLVKETHKYLENDYRYLEEELIDHDVVGHQILLGLLDFTLKTLKEVEITLDTIVKEFLDASYIKK